jgi:hypothetical protein
LLYMDVAKVDRDVKYVAYFCKCFQCYVASLLKNIFLDICCNKCFMWMLHMLFYLDIVYVSHTCYKCFYLDVAYV